MVEENIAIESKKREIMDLTWVITEKNKSIKARLCVRGYQEREEVRKDSPTVSKPGLRILFSVAASRGWDLYSIDAKSAFLQGDSIDRLVYVYPPREYNSEENKVLVMW